MILYTYKYIKLYSKLLRIAVYTTQLHIFIDDKYILTIYTEFLQCHRPYI